MLPVVELHSAASARIAAGLKERVKQAPGFFHNAPMVVDCTHLTPEEPLDFPGLVRLMRRLQLNPVAVRGGGRHHAEAARAAGLTVLAEPSQVRRGARADESSSSGSAGDGARGSEPPAPPPEPPAVNVVHARPVRSGQQITAPSGDLTVTASTSPGSELIAAGNIHVYGALRGRAIAGANGDQSRRIFCLSLDAELVCVAGTYRVSEEIRDGFQGRAAQIFLEGNRLEIALLNSAGRPG